VKINSGRDENSAGKKEAPRSLRGHPEVEIGWDSGGEFPHRESGQSIRGIITSEED